MPLLASGTSLSAILAGVLSTISTAVLLFFGRWIWLQIQRTLNEGRASTEMHLDRIEDQTKKTNGAVARHELQLQEFDKRLIKEEAKTELLTEIYLKKQAP